MAKHRSTIAPPLRAVNQGNPLSQYKYLLAILMLGILTWRQSYAYRDSATLWMDTFKKNLRSWMAYNHLGIIVTREGNPSLGEEYFKKALSINPELLAGC